MHIGVLEDNSAILEYLKITLEMAGHRVHAHTQAASLLATLFTESGVVSPLPYDLITVDLLLPGGISGLEVIARIHHAIPHEKLPVILISGAGDCLSAQAHRDFPYVSLLNKPFKRNDLLRLIEELTCSQEKEEQRRAELPQSRGSAGSCSRD